MKRILSITIKRETDDSPDTSWLGEYSRSPKGDFAIDRKHTLECAVNSDTSEVVDKLERVIAYLDKQRININADNPQFDYDSISEAQDILIEAQDNATECDCDEDGYWPHGELQYFNPGSVEKFDPTASWIPATETDKRAYWLAAMRENARKDYERMESYNAGDWGFVCVAAVAEIQLETHEVIQTITSGYCCGVESDGDYWKEVGKEQLSELRSQLSAIGFSKRAIATAVKNLVEVE